LTVARKKANNGEGLVGLADADSGDGILPIGGKAKPKRPARRETVPDAGPKAGGNGKAGNAADPEVHTEIIPALPEWTEDDTLTLNRIELEIEEHVEGVILVAERLAEVREKQLWRKDYGSYGEYVEKRWAFSRRYAEILMSGGRIIRQLEAAGIPAEDLPQKVEHVKPLMAVEPEQRAEVWKEAVETAKAREKSSGKKSKGNKGKAKPSRKEVEKAIEAKTGKTPKPRIPRDIKKARDNGAIPKESEVTIETPIDLESNGEMVETKADVETPDAEWLEQFPIRPRLNDYCRMLFDAEALAFRWMTPHRLKFVEAIRPIVAEAKGKAKRIGPYISRLYWFLTAKEPEKWTLCPSCTGTGDVPTLGKCTDCRGAGFQIN
jgi:hypothetical protein